MKFRDVLKGLRIVFGFFYFLLNVVIFVTMLILVTNAFLSNVADTGWFMLIFPAAGLFAGNWIRHGRFGIWRNIVIFVSLVCMAAMIYLAFFFPSNLHLSN